ncbi:MAG: SpvB/TcaC N-terminal domain-containing protein [Nitrospirota bacterium]|nr:SpvB/TcaC N-terminal domain-containing protein [Nitrospirota bacterium]
MAEDKGPKGSGTDSAPATNQISAPTISLPKGGGAIRGMGEKFAANPVTGTGSMSVPIATSPSRSGFGPQLSLSYDSGAGNGPFGLGWNLSLPSITRKTDKGLPRYQDADESDVFILSGAEDLVPILTQNGGGQWVPEDLPPRTVNSTIYRVQRYRPRIEGLFARIERWTNQTDPQDSFWRSISRDNITTWYGKTSESRLADPADLTRIFSWLICESYDDKGNVISYRYKAENSDDVDLSQVHERNRTPDTRKANRYLKHIRYGNHAPYFPKLTETNPWPTLPPDSEWFFEVVFDYGEHDAEAPTPTGEIAQWPRRNDPFSTYRAGFEIRTYRLCQRVLMFHHFPTESEVGADCLVRSTDFNYSYEESPTDARNPIFSTLLSVSQSGYKRQGVGYLKKSLPPVEFQYAEPNIDGAIQDVDADSLENLPYGLDGAAYQWTDLHGEGIPGILTEQAEGWFYKRNLSPINLVKQNGDTRALAKFAPVELVATKPNTTIAGGQTQFMDLAGDGQPDLVMLDGPTPGLYEHDEGTSWDTFRPFTSRLNHDMGDPNLKFVDLDGDGHADVLITEEEAFTWHPSLAEEGFGPAQRVAKARDEEQGPALVFADGTQSIYLADLSGDGLTDLVRIRNGAVCYWPNLGYGRFGAKVTMDNAPWFDNPDQFDQRRVHLADIDGSGGTDILYLHGDGVRLYFNQSGNSWSQPSIVPAFPRIDHLAAVTVVDLLGNGTACLIWSSPSPGDTRSPMRYIDLMGGQKPHLLVKTINNLGAETVVTYVPSTKFYLADKLAGKPWITKLPFPVHCVEKVTVTDKWRQTTFSTTYSYHHGYFDGAEREFRGFGRVEQVDVESYGEFAQGNSASPYITDDKTLYQPPVKTVTWYHTGAMIERERILSQFAHEYFPRWFEDVHPDVINVLGDFEENVLPEPDLDAEDLSGEEWRDALRACKGMMLRQETYELDVDALERGEHQLVQLFSTAYHNCHIRRLQAKALNRHAVFLVAESEAITYHYELDLRPDTLRPDPRIAHTLNLQFDEYANVLQSVTVVYPRLGQFEDNSLPVDALALIHRVQQETHLAYTETRYTNDVADPDNYRLRVPCEVLTYELSGISPEDGDDLLSPDPRDNRYFTLDELRRFRLSLVHQTAGEAVPEIAYHQLPNGTAPQKRLVEHGRVLFFEDDAPALNDPLPIGQLGRLGVPYETYKLALTDDLLGAIFGAKLTPDVHGKLGDASISGYLSGATLAARFPGDETDGQYWVRTGIAGFAPDAAQHFYLSERFTDPFGNVTTLEYDPLDLFVASSTDALSNTTRVTRFDFRVLAPREMQDINDNLSEVFFDLLGLPTAMAVKGKGNEGDNLTGFDDALANPELADLTAFFTAPAYDEAPARRWLGNATARHVYYFGETRNADSTIAWGTHPSCACGIVRETHVGQLVPGEQSVLQAGFEYSDGMGSVGVTKVQAEPEAPGQPFRWVANGKTILNNKGKPVKQYEPYFSSSGHRFEEPVEVGVTPVMYYDAPGRVIRMELPDGTFSRVEFSPWHVISYDPNDTVRESTWYADRNPPERSQPLPRDLTGQLLVTEDQRAAWLAAQHADTPSLTLLDSLGREVIGIAHNRVKDPSGPHIFGGENWKDEYYLTYTKLDAEGKPLWIRDARKNLVMQYITPPVPDNQVEDPTAGFAPCYDIAGNLLFQHSMDAGDRWMLNDAAGKPMFAWNNRGYAFRTEYDRLHRPIRSFVQGGDSNDSRSEFFAVEFLVGRTVYGERHPEAQARNIRGGAFMQLDQAGVVTNEQIDFKGNPLRGSRQLARECKKTIDWSAVETQLPTDVNVTLNIANLNNALASLLETETFTSSSSFDAMNRPIQLVAPHSDRPGTKLNVICPGYNEASLLERVDVWLEQANEPAVLLDSNTATQHMIGNIDYNAKGQRTRIEYGNGVSTTYEYDPLTFRLVRLLTDRGTGFTNDWPQPPDPPRGGIQNLSYFYDPVGNITRIHDDAQETNFFNGQRVEPSADYEYDPIYRLIAATGREHIGQQASPQVDEDDSPRMNQPLPTDSVAMRNYTERYDYDSVGNILRMIHQAGATGSWTRRYDYESISNRLRATSLPGDADGVFSATYAYDPHGNMTRMPHLPLMQWDYRDQLQATSRQVVTEGRPETTYYVYDDAGQRVRKVTERQAAAGQMPSRMKDRIYLGGFEIYREYENDGESVTLERETVHVMDDKQRIALVETRTQGDDDSPQQLIRYQFGNHLGSASLELDDEARVITYEEYTPYGSTSYQAGRSAAEVSLKRYRYTGMERDEESGFNYHGARYYAAWLGRWVSCDPIGMDGGLNVYTYADDNPVQYRDPSGLDSQAVGQLSDEELLNLANRDPIYVNSTCDALCKAVANGLSAAPTEEQFESGLIKRVTEAQSAYDWTRGPNIDWEYDPVEAHSAWRAFANAEFRADRQVRNAELQASYRRMDTAANISKVIGATAIVATAAFGLAAAAGPGSLIGGGLNLGGGATTTTGAGTLSTTIQYSAARAAQTVATNTAAYVGVSVAYGVIMPPGSPDIPGPGDDAGRAARGAASVGDEAAEAFIGTERIIADYNVVGQAQRVGNTYIMTISGWFERVGESQGIRALLNALRAEAKAAGASEIQIIGAMVENPILKKMNPAIAAKFGLTLEPLSPTWFRLSGPVQ